MTTLLDAPAARKINTPAGYKILEEAALRTLDHWDIDLFVLPKHASSPVLLKEAGMKVNEISTQRFADHSELPILARERDHEALSRQMLGQLDELVTDDSLPPAERFALVQFAAAAEVEHAWKLVRPDKLVELSDTLSTSITTLLHGEASTPHELFNIAKHDYQTFTHVTNVACYAVLLAEAIGCTNEDEQREIAQGGFLHDMGKRHIPGEILRKPSRLNDEERRIIQTHTQLGYEELLGREDVTRNQLLMVYQHHEWVDGGGYPVGVKGEELHPWSKLLAVVDVFDAMTGSRPYRKPCTPREAIEFMEEKSDVQFDKEIVQCWKAKVAAN